MDQNNVDKLIEKMRNELNKYYHELKQDDKESIISQSDKTSFYADVFLYLQEHKLPVRLAIELNSFARPLLTLYNFFMCQNLNAYQRTNILAKVLGEYQKKYGISNKDDRAGERT